MVQIVSPEKEQEYLALREQRLAKLKPEQRAIFAEPRRSDTSKWTLEIFRERLKKMQGPQVLAEGVTYQDVEISGPHGPIPTRIYTPPGKAKKRGIYLSIHAGGFIVGDGLGASMTSDSAVARDTDCIVVSPDFRMPPDYKFPVPIDDNWAVTQWVGENARELGGDPARIGVGGGCSGGNMSAVMTLMARDAGNTKFACAVYTGAVFDLRTDYDSFAEFDLGYTLTAQFCRWAYEHYMSSYEDRWDWRASPVLAESLRGLPPALIRGGEWDVLKDEGVHFATRLREAGVEVDHALVPESSHHISPWMRPALRKEIISYIRAKIGADHPSAN